MRRIIPLACGTLLMTGCSGNQSMFNPQGPIARILANLGWFLIGLSAVVYVAVMIALAVALWRRRRDTDVEPETTARLGRNVTLASAITVIVLVAVAVVTFASERRLTTPTDPRAMTVVVTGHQWWWDFQYDDVSPQNLATSPNELHVPIGVPVVLHVRSRDVIHSFWVPNLLGKRDLIPGFESRTWLQADELGVYRGQCAEFCGYQHAHMAFHVVAERMDKFQAWIQHQREPAIPPATDEQRHGKDVFMQSACVTCHTIRGTDAGARVGPDLTHVGSRLMIAAGSLPNTRSHLSAWVVNSQKAKPGNRMPPIGLAENDLQAVLSYLRSLR